MNDDRIQIKGTKEGINVIIDIEKFDNFDQMLLKLLERLRVGKKFYKGSAMNIITNLDFFNEDNISKLKNALFEEIQIKECIFEKPKKVEIKDDKVFNGVYEGKTKFLRKTIRSGQVVKYIGNIVIIGDINNGSEVYAGGNIIVLGAIKGHVHAGMGGNKKAMISAFSLQPEVLQIADIVTISPDDTQKPIYPELARIKGNMIVVEPYLPKKYL